VAVILVAAVAGVFSELTRARNRDYWSDEGLWLDTMQKRPMNANARVGYAVNLLAQQRWQEAEEQLQVAVRIDPNNEHAHVNLGSALSAQGRIDEGIAHLEQARALAPGLPETYGLLGEAYATQGSMALALQHFFRAIELLPDNPTLLGRVAFLLATSPDGSVRDGARAVELASRAVRLTGGHDVRALDTLAAAHAERGDFMHAVAVTQEALTLAQAQGAGDVGLELQRRLELYQAGRKLRVPHR
jgi:cytochrome c-type biogenesis protein CcmH/NrfG